MRLGVVVLVTLHWRLVDAGAAAEHEGGRLKRCGETRLVRSEKPDGEGEVRREAIRAPAGRRYTGMPIAHRIRHRPPGPVSTCNAPARPLYGVDPANKKILCEYHSVPRHTPLQPKVTGVGVSSHGTSPVSVSPRVSGLASCHARHIHIGSQTHTKSMFTRCI